MFFIFIVCFFKLYSIKLEKHTTDFSCVSNHLSQGLTCGHEAHVTSTLEPSFSHGEQLLVELLASLLQAVDEPLSMLGILACKQRVVDHSLAQAVHVRLQIGRKVDVDYVLQVGNGYFQAYVLECGHYASGGIHKHYSRRRPNF